MRDNHFKLDHSKKKIPDHYCSTNVNKFASPVNAERAQFNASKRNDLYKNHFNYGSHSCKPNMAATSHSFYNKPSQAKVPGGHNSLNNAAVLKHRNFEMKDFNRTGSQNFSTNYMAAQRWIQPKI